MRIGQGYDVHRLVEDRKLILGGVEIPFEKGLLGHSDADVLIHAIIDATDNDEQFAGISSRILLQKVCAAMQEKEVRLQNLDATICAQNPKLRPFIDKMRENIAADLQVEVEQISVKATTEEGLGISGSGAGISAFAVVLLA